MMSQLQEPMIEDAGRLARDQIRYRRIVVPTDFSEIASAALDWAGAIASRSGASIDVVYADPFMPPPHFTATQLDRIAEGIDRAKDDAKAELSRYVQSRFPSGTPARPIVLEGLAVPSILAWSGQIAADLVVMGTHGRSGLNRLMLGSVTERILRETNQPLLVVRPGRAAAADLKHIVCPVNFTGFATAAIAHAAELARIFGARLTLLHARESPLPDAETKLEECSLPLRGVAQIERVVLDGRADEVVIDYANQNGADLIVLAARHRRFFDTTVLGSTTVHVVRHAQVPVLTVVGRDGE
jgi:nucleotide-binding universal stress UspA family protein